MSFSTSNRLAEQSAAQWLVAGPQFSAATGFWKRLLESLAPRRPLAALPQRHGSLSATQLSRWVWGFIALGLALRLARYFLRFPLWGDEALLAANLLDRGYLDVLKPLKGHQVAPLLFLWVELAAVKLLGFSEYSLRLFPFLCSIASLFVFRHLAKSLFRGTALVLAVAIFAVSYPCVRYAAETKPYGVDLLVSALLLALVVDWWRRPQETWRLWVLTAFVPIGLGLSYPAVFIAGSVSLVVAATLSARPSPRGWAAWFAYNLVLVASFVGFFAFCTGKQLGSELPSMTVCWKETFPPLDSVRDFAEWFVATHAGTLLPHPFGGYNGGSSLTLLFCAVAVVLLVRRGQSLLLMLCLGPFAFNFVAALLHRYPYGGHMRLSLYLAPLVCLMAGLGAAATLGWRRFAPSQTGRECRVAPALLAALAGLGLLGAVSIARDFLSPTKDSQDLTNRDFARWFWTAMDRDHEMACVNDDQDVTWVENHWGRQYVPPGGGCNMSAAARHLCNARIYSPRCTRGERPRLDRVSASRPLVWVQFRSADCPGDQTARDRWLEEMKRRHVLASVERYPLVTDDRSLPLNYVEVFELGLQSGEAARPRPSLSR
jgi:hypothetical protein